MIGCLIFLGFTMTIFEILVFYLILDLVVADKMLLLNSNNLALLRKVYLVTLEFFNIYKLT